MIGSECEQLKLDNDWNLTRTNACHIAVQNDEMGSLRDAMLEIGWKVNLMLGATAPIYLAIVALVIKQLWGKK